MASRTENRSINLYLNGKSAGGSIKQMRAEFTRLNRETQKLDRNSKEYNQNIEKLRRLKAGITEHNRAIRGVETRWQKLTGVVRKFAPFAAGAVAGATFMRAVRGAIQTITAYQDANARLASVLGVTRQETKKLQEQQIALGSSTAFTAAQAADAQTELAKLGFTMREITNLTPAVLNLAAASGTDLANAASIAGSTLRQFGLDSSETDRVVDVMAASFSKSALDIEKFSVAMAAAGPVAKAVGVDLEQATSMIGVLVNQGLDASTAGTSLRNIFLDLKKEGLEFNEAMEMIRTSTDQAGTAFDLFGKRGATTGVILANNAEAAADLETALRDAAGAAEAMAETQLDTLSGDVTKLTSAWEGFILSLENGTGPIASTARALIKISTSAIQALSSFESISAQIKETTGRNVGWVDRIFNIKDADKLIWAQERVNGLRKDIEKFEQVGDYDGLKRFIELNLENKLKYVDEGTDAWKIYTNAIKEANEVAETMAAESAFRSISSSDFFNDGGDDPVNNLNPNAEDPKVQRTRITMEKIKTLTATLGNEINQIEQEIAEKGLAIRSNALWDWEQLQQNAADGDKRRAIGQLQTAQAVAGGVSQSLGQIAAAAGASAEHQQEIGNFMNTVNSGIALGQAVASVKSSDPFSYLAILGSVVAIITSITGQAQDATNAASLPGTPAFATGTDSAPGGFALVGETGPELVNIPQGSSVTPSGPSRNLIFGSNPQLDPDAVPDLSGSGSNAMLDELRAMRAEINQWPRRLRVENVQSDFDEFSERYEANRKRVRNVRA
jgi:hypothetical protein